MEKTIKEWNEKLEALREKAAELRHLERRSEQLERMLNEGFRRIAELSVENDREQRDVERLERRSWSNLFHSMLGNKEEKLDIERQEALSAALKLQDARQASDELEREKREVADRLSEVYGAEAAYTELLLKKEQYIRSAETEASRRLTELDERLLREQAEAKELREAAEVCRRLAEALGRASDKLGSAKDWGTYDMLGGGIISTSIKHSRIDEAQDSIYEAQIFALRLQTELNDLKRTADLSIDVGDMAKFADYFFDGLIADWIVQDRIKSSLNEVDSRLSEAERLLAGLEGEVKASERRQEAIRRERTELVESFA